MAETHNHDGQVHRHEHTHVTHYLRHGQQWDHMGASHDHEHNHAAVTHSHEPHEDPDQEHVREAHIHDHERPAQSPA
jgi:urease accessory protein